MSVGSERLTERQPQACDWSGGLVVAAANFISWSPCPLLNSLASVQPRQNRALGKGGE
jgi:hypothetical protein